MTLSSAPSARRLRVGVAGLGAVAQAVHLPLLARLPRVAAPGEGAVGIKRSLLVLVEEEGGAGVTGLRDERHDAVV